MEGLRILLLCTVLAIVYGIVHDQITARVCVEYFTIGHPRVIESESPTALAFVWGVLATWWVGVGLGLLLAAVSRLGSRPRLVWPQVLRPALVLLVVMAVLATAAGFIGWWLARDGNITLRGALAERVPAARHVAFLADLWAHLASYITGALGGIVVAVVLWRRRGGLARSAGVIEPGLAGNGAAALALLVIAALGFGGCLESRQKTVLGSDGSGWMETTITLDVAARDELLRRLARIYGATEDPDRLPFADPFHPRWVRALAEGVEDFTLEKVERTERDGKRTTSISARFSKLRAAVEAGAFLSASVSLEKDPSGELWQLVVEDAWVDALTQDDGELGGRPASEFLGALQVPLAGFSIERIFVLPTKVAKTNGRVEPDGRTVRWTTDFTSLQKRENLLLRITFEHAEGMELTKFAFQQDPDALVRRVLESPPR